MQGVEQNSPQNHLRSRFDATVRCNRLICREHYYLLLHVAGGMGPSHPGQFVQLGCRPPDAAIDQDQLFGREVTWTDTAPSHVVGRGLSQMELCRPTAMLRRPMSIADRSEDDEGTQLAVIHRVVGVGTQWLADLQEGDAVALTTFLPPFISTTSSVGMRTSPICSSRPKA